MLRWLRFLILAISLVISNSLSCNLMNRVVVQQPTSLELDEQDRLDMSDACRPTIILGNQWDDHSISIFVPDGAITQNCIAYFCNQGWREVSRQSHQQRLYLDPFQAQEGSEPKLRWGMTVRFTRIR